MKRFAFLPLLVCGWLSCFSQRIYFCNNYTTAGEPVGAANTWNITKAGGGNVYILFQNGGKGVNSSQVSFYIDYLSGSEYKYWDTRLTTTSYYDSWTVLDYKFTSSGSYRIAIWINGTEIAKDYVTISNAVSTSATSSYTGASVTTGTDIDLNSGYIYNLGSAFTMGSLNVAKIYFKLSNAGRGIGTSKIYADVYQLNSLGAYDLLASDNFDVKNSSLDWVYFSHEFISSGSYKVSVYDAVNQLISAAYLTISGNSTGTQNNNSSGNSSTNVMGVTAGTNIDFVNGYVYGATGSFQRNSTVYFKVSGGGYTLGGTVIQVDVVKDGASFNKQRYDIKDRDWVFFKKTFTEAGSYNVSVSVITQQFGDDKFSYIGGTTITIY